MGSRVASTTFSAHSSVLSSRSKRHRGRGRLNYANLYTRASESEEIYDMVHGPPSDSHGHNNGLYAKSLDDVSGPSGPQSIPFDDIRPEDAADAVSFVST